MDTLFQGTTLRGLLLNAAPSPRLVGTACGARAAFLITAGWVVVWIRFDVRGFRLALARGWHGVRSAARTGGQPAGGTDFPVRT